MTMPPYPPVQLKPPTCPDCVYVRLDHMELFPQGNLADVRGAQKSYPPGQWTVVYAELRAHIPTLNPSLRMVPIPTPLALPHTGQFLPAGSTQSPNIVAIDCDSQQNFGVPPHDVGSVVVRVTVYDAAAQTTQTLDWDTQPIVG